MYRWKICEHAHERRPANLLAALGIWVFVKIAALISFTHLVASALAGRHLNPDDPSCRSTPRMHKDSPHANLSWAAESDPNKQRINLATQCIACSIESSLPKGVEKPI